MADEDIIPTPEIPPQATGATLPGQAAAFGGFEDLAQAPTAEQALLPAAYGDQGAQQYQDLRAAGQVAPTPSAAPAGAAAGSVGGVGRFFGGDPNSFSPIFSLLAGPQGQAKMAASFGALRAQAQQQQQRAAASATSALDFLTKLRAGNIPPDVRVGLINEYAASQGRQLSPAQTAYIAHMSNDPDLMQHLLERINVGDPEATAEFGQLFSGDAGKMVSAADSIRKSSAQADEAIANAKKAQEAASPEALDATRQKAALDVALKIRQAQLPPSDKQIGTLADAGLEAVQVPIPGVPGGKMWTTQPMSQPAGATPAAAGTTPGTVSPAAMEKRKSAEAASTALAKEQATTTAATRAMKETAPKIRGLIDKTEAALKKVETGPFASRLQAFMAGNIGAPNPDFMTYKANTDLLSSLLVRMHMGARGGEYASRKFDNMIGANRQSAENMHATLSVLRDYADIVDHEKEGGEVTYPWAMTSTQAGEGTGTTGEISAQDFLNQ